MPGNTRCLLGPRQSTRTRQARSCCSVSPPVCLPRMPRTPSPSCPGDPRTEPLAGLGPLAMSPTPPCQSSRTALHDARRAFTRLQTELWQFHRLNSNGHVLEVHWAIVCGGCRAQSLGAWNSALVWGAPARLKMPLQTIASSSNPRNISCMRTSVSSPQS
jgi:hypothetical protein